MPKAQLASPGDATIENEQSLTSTVTKWEVFDQAGVVPTQIVCQDYWPMHPHDNSCHSRLQLQAAAVLRHMDAAHETGGGFQVVLRQSDGKTWQGWKDLQTAGAELHDIRCETCNAEIQLSPRSILRHMRAHNGKSRRIVDIKTFNMTIKFGAPDQGVESDD